MTLTIAKEGHVTYTERAFAEDAHEAMGGRIEKGLVELVTNSDDRYTVLGSKDLAGEEPRRRGKHDPLDNYSLTYRRFIESMFSDPAINQALGN